RKSKWEDAKIALDFFNQYLPFWDMIAMNDISSDNDADVFGQENKIYLMYIPAGQSPTISLGNTGINYDIKWFNPKSGGNFQNGSLLTVSAGNSVTLGAPPHSPNEDWLALLKNESTLSTVEEDDFNFKLYPNPTKDFFKILGLDLAEYQIQIYNISGQMVLKSSITSSSRVNISNLSLGCYFVHLKSNKNSSKIKKLIIY
ncbi:MAG: T9SS type A sorting domain-containing protein, partial [Bacteroidota bacterium]